MMKYTQNDPTENLRGVIVRDGFKAQENQKRRSVISSGIEDMVCEDIWASPVQKEDGI